MEIEYSQQNKNFLQKILEQQRHLTDFVNLLNQSEKIQRALQKIESRISHCKTQLNYQIPSLERSISESNAHIRDAENAIKNSINSDVTGKHKETIEYNREKINKYSARLSLLQEDRNHLQNAEETVNGYLRLFSELINNLEDEKHRADRDCDKYRSAINMAAAFMTDYANAFGNIDSFCEAEEIREK